MSLWEIAIVFRLGVILGSILSVMGLWLAGTLSFPDGIWVVGWLMLITTGVFVWETYRGTA